MLDTAKYPEHPPRVLTLESIGVTFCRRPLWQRVLLACARLVWR